MGGDIIDLRYFGSAVRGDSDANSDVDVLCVLSQPHEGTSGLMGRLDEHFVAGRHVDISFYGAQRIVQMWEAGHLFAWHLFLESKAVGAEFQFIESLGRPHDYADASADIARLVEIVEDVKLSSEQGMVSSIYEAGLLYVAARNIGIAASWVSDNGLDFSRNAPFSLRFFEQDYPFAVGSDSYSMLRRARHASMRGGEPPDLTMLDFMDVSDKILRWVDGMKKLEVGI
jgi:hypothetical protein